MLPKDGKELTSLPEASGSMQGKKVLMQTNEGAALLPEESAFDEFATAKGLGDISDDGNGNMLYNGQPIKGGSTALVFDTVSDMNAWLKDVDNKGKVEVGTDIFIKDAEAPDYWVSEVLEQADGDGFYYHITEQAGSADVDGTTLIRNGQGKIAANIDNDTLQYDETTGKLKAVLNSTIALNVVYYRSVNLTISKGSETYSFNRTASERTAEILEQVISTGTWNISGTIDGDTISKEVTVTSSGAYVTVEIEPTVLYGFKMQKSETNPKNKVTYLEEAVDMTPAKMNFTSGEFEPGSWDENVFFRKNNYPAMVTNNGEEDYKLDPNDYTKKLDGTASDVSNLNYAGNAMVRIDRVWLKQWEADGYEYCYISNRQIDNDYHAYAHQRADGTIMDYIWLSAFEGSLNSNKVRSIKGQSPMTNQSGTNELTYAKANNPSGKTIWSTRSWSQHNLINMLLILMGKSTDTQDVFGYGYYEGATSGSPNFLTTGGASDKGAFYGQGSSVKRGYVKVFHIENYYGDVWERIEGCVTDGSKKILIKDAPPYNTTGSGYSDTGVTPGGTSGGYISACKMTEHGLIPATASGSETTQYPDGLWFNSSCYAFVGGDGSTGLRVGALALFVYYAVSVTGWDVGSALSCEQPSAA